MGLWPKLSRSMNHLLKLLPYYYDIVPSLITTVHDITITASRYHPAQKVV